MKNRFKAIFLATNCIVLSISAVAMTTSEYIKKYKDCAIEQMLVYNIPASITLAQGILESECGSSPLAIFANNHFGIKCHDDWAGAYYVMDDDKIGEHFRKYQDVDESYRDHAEFLKSRPWYMFLFNYSRSDYRDWAKGLAAAGYATASDYAWHLTKIIEQNHLYVYDTVLQKLQGLSVLYNINPGLEGKQCGEEYVVIKQGDCIYKIAREYSVDVVTLCRNNGISINDVLVPGQKLYLKAKKNESNLPPPAKNSNGTVMTILLHKTNNPES